MLPESSAVVQPMSLSRTVTFFDPSGMKMSWSSTRALSVPPTIDCSITTLFARRMMIERKRARMVSPFAPLTSIEPIEPAPWVPMRPAALPRFTLPIAAVTQAALAAAQRGDQGAGARDVRGAGDARRRGDRRDRARGRRCDRSFGLGPPGGAPAARRTFTLAVLARLLAAAVDRREADHAAPRERNVWRSTRPLPRLALALVPPVHHGPAEAARAALRRAGREAERLAHAGLGRGDLDPRPWRSRSVREGDRQRHERDRGERLEHGGSVSPDSTISEFGPRAEGRARSVRLGRTWPI